MTISECKTILGLDTTYSKKELIQAYRKKVLEYHPDRNDGQLTEKFLQVQHAYDILQNNKSSTNYKVNQDRKFYSQKEQASYQYKSTIFDRQKQDQDYRRIFLKNLKIGCFWVITISVLCIIIGIIHE